MSRSSILDEKKLSLRQQFEVEYGLSQHEKIEQPNKALKLNKEKF
ncbi:hypothetical protein ACBQ24_05675 [Acinetobacter terrestris]